MNAITETVQQWLDSLSHSTGRAGSFRPAQEPDMTNKSSTEPLLLAPPTNDHGENWMHAIHACGERHGNTHEQIKQAIDRAQALVGQGHSTARAVSIVSSKLRQRARFNLVPA